MATDWKPIPKVQASAAAGFLSTLLVFSYRHVTGEDPPADVTAAAVGIIMAGVAYMVPSHTRAARHDFTAGEIAAIKRRLQEPQLTAAEIAKLRQVMHEGTG